MYRGLILLGKIRVGGNRQDAKSAKERKERVFYKLFITAIARLNFLDNSCRGSPPVAAPTHGGCTNHLEALYIWRLRTANLGFSNINDGLKTGEKVNSQQTIDKSGSRQIGGEDGEIVYTMTQTAEPRDSHHRRCNSATPCEGCEPAQRILQIATDFLRYL